MYGRCTPAPAGVQGRDIPLPAQVRRRARHARRPRGAAGPAPQPGARPSPAAAPSTTSTELDHRYLSTRRTARRAARRPSSSPSGPDWCSISSRRSAPTSSGPRRSDSCNGPCGPGRPTRTSRSSATPRPNGCPSCPSWCVDRAGAYLHHNFVVSRPQRPVRHPVAGRVLVRRSVWTSPARHRPRPVAPVRAGDRRRVRRDQARLGPGQLQLLHRRGDVRLHRGRGRPRRPRRLAAAARLPLRPVPRTLAHHRDGIVEPPLRLSHLRYDADGSAAVPVPSRAGRRRTRWPSI